MDLSKNSSALKKGTTKKVIGKNISEIISQNSVEFGMSNLETKCKNLHNRLCYKYQKINYRMTAVLRRF